MARTDTLGNFLTDVADAIRTKTGDSSPIQASNFDTEIENLPSGGDLSEYFEEYYKAGSNTYGGFSTAIKKLPPIKIMWSITNVSYMFAYYKGVELDLSQINTSIIKNMSNMFVGCTNLTSLDLRGFTSTLQLTSTASMFHSCTSLMHIDMRTFDFSAVTNYQLMFGGATTANQVPANCEIIVADATQKAWITSKFDRMTNVKTVAELSEE